MPSDVQRSVIDQPLIEFPTDEKRFTDRWTVGDACQGTQIFGATGSGKTSGSGHTIARAFLNKGYGGLVLCAKVDERELWEGYARNAGRSDDVTVFSPESGYRFNFLDYEMTREGKGAGLTANIAQLFAKALEVGGRSRNSRNADPFWDRMMLQMLNNAIDLLVPSGEPLRLESIYDVIASAPQSPEEAKDPAWSKDSYLFSILQQGNTRINAGLHPQRKRDFNLAARYWIREFPRLAPRTRSSVVSVFTSMADGFMRGPMHDLFCTDTNMWPEWTHDGGIIILDLPVKEYGEVGVIAQGIFKYVWQQAVERRKVTQATLPVFLWADESQFFTNSYDMLFQTTARGARAATVYLTQNLSNYYTVMPGENGRAAVDALMGHFQTKIFHTNGDAVTNRWASEQIGETFQAVMTVNHGKEHDPMGDSHTTTSALLPNVLPSEFLTLTNGGTYHERKVQAFMLKPGQKWVTTLQPHRLVEFEQEKQA